MVEIPKQDSPPIISRASNAECPKVQSGGTASTPSNHSHPCQPLSQETDIEETQQEENTECDGDPEKLFLEKVILADEGIHRNEAGGKKR